MPAQESVAGFATRNPQFKTTHWSVVLAAGQSESHAARTAMEELCRTYWYPIYAFVRRQGRTPPDAQDLTQEFFARLLEKNYVSSVRPERGRFRVFLLTAVKHFLAKEWDKSQAFKRGGRTRLLSFEDLRPEERFHLEPADRYTPETLFERRWAMVLLNRVLERLCLEYAQAGQTRLFDTLKHCLTEKTSSTPYAVLAPELGLSEAAVKQAVHRMRMRYRDGLAREIANTVSSPVEIEDELRYLFKVLAR